MAVQTEVLVIGAGPAGLTAAIYLARFRRKVLVCDAGRSRTRLIPVSHNCPGFAHGIAGPELLRQLVEQAATHGIHVQAEVVKDLRRAGERFEATTNAGIIQADRVVLATGVVDVLPQIEGCAEAIAQGVIRLCPICDAYETIGKRVAVYGPAQEAERHARYLRTFSADVTAVALADVHTLEVHAQGARLHTTSGMQQFDVVYPVLGIRPSSQLACELGAKCDERGYIVTDAHQRTTIAGLYAIGDVAQDVNQIAVATGHAAIAATAIHNELPPRWL